MRRQWRAADMNSDFDRAPITLGKDMLLQLRDAVGTGVGLFEGLVWITQHGDPRDILLEAGESFVFDRPGLAIVQALLASKLLLFELEPEARPTRPQDVAVRAGAA